MKEKNRDIVTLYSVNLPSFIETMSGYLKEIIKIPEWAKFVKTSTGCENTPSNPDWWFLRAASIIQKVYRKKKIGQRRLAKEYSRSKNRGTRSNKSSLGSRKIIRVICQDLETAGLMKIEISKKGIKKGRALTNFCISFINRILKENFNE